MGSNFSTIGNPDVCSNFCSIDIETNIMAKFNTIYVSQFFTIIHAFRSTNWAAICSTKYDANGCDA